MKELERMLLGELYNPYKVVTILGKNQSSITKI